MTCQPNPYMYIGELFDDITEEKLIKSYPNVDMFLELSGNVAILRGRRIRTCKGV